jgi:hypothetical protein
MTLWVILVKEPASRGGREQGARSKELGVCEERSDEVADMGGLAKSEASRSCTLGCEAKDLKTLCNKSFFNSDN